MSRDVARRGVAYVVANAAQQGTQEVSISFHGGGEPTLNWNVMKEALSYARELAAKHSIKVLSYTATNGVMSDEKRHWIVEHLSGCSLSFDGLPELQDKQRPTASGQGSSDSAVETMRFFDSHNFDCGVRLAVTLEQLSTLSASIAHICENSRVQRIQVEPAYALGRWRDAPSAETTEFIRNYREAEVVATRYGRHLAFSGARVGLITNHFCGVTQDSFSLSPDGNVSACYEVRSRAQR